MTNEEILDSFQRGRQPGIATLGAEAVEVDAEAGRVVMRCTATVNHCHSTAGHPRGGIVQGGFVTGWLDTSMAHAAIAKSAFKLLVPTLEVKVSFLNAAHPGIYHATGQVVRWGRNVAFLDARLVDADDKLIATATSTVMLAPAPARRTAGV